MKSYIQGMITGGVLVFAMIVFMGSNKMNGHGRWTYFSNSEGQVFFDTVEGKAYTRGFMDIDFDGIDDTVYGYLDANKIKQKAEERKGLKGY
jgi:hypothetical protein